MLTEMSRITKLFSSEAELEAHIADIDYQLESFQKICYAIVVED